jgi:hypothetical protein
MLDPFAIELPRSEDEYTPEDLNKNLDDFNLALAEFREAVEEYLEEVEAVDRMRRNPAWTIEDLQLPEEDIPEWVGAAVGYTIDQGGNALSALGFI